MGVRHEVLPEEEEEEEEKGLSVDAGTTMLRVGPLFVHEYGIRVLVGEDHDCSFTADGVSLSSIGEGIDKGLLEDPWRKFMSGDGLFVPWDRVYLIDIEYPLYPRWFTPFAVVMAVMSYGVFQLSPNETVIKMELKPGYPRKWRMGRSPVRRADRQGGVAVDWMLLTLMEHDRLEFLGRPKAVEMLKDVKSCRSPIDPLTRYRVNKVVKGYL